jgi:hypothetical protein
VKKKNKEAEQSNNFLTLTRAVSKKAAFLFPTPFNTAVFAQ